jgi:hypothetical protein
MTSEEVFARPATHPLRPLTSTLALPQSTPVPLDGLDITSAASHPSSSLDCRSRRRRESLEQSRDDPNDGLQETGHKSAKTLAEQHAHQSPWSLTSPSPMVSSPGSSPQATAPIERMAARRAASSRVVIVTAASFASFESLTYRRGRGSETTVALSGWPDRHHLSGRPDSQALPGVRRTCQPQSLVLQEGSAMRAIGNALGRLVSGLVNIVVRLVGGVVGGLARGLSAPFR